MGHRREVILAEVDFDAAKAIGNAEPIATVEQDPESYPRGFCHVCHGATFLAVDYGACPRHFRLRES